MPQIKQSCSVTQGSQLVVLTGIDLTERIKANHIFQVDGLYIPYTVAADSTLVSGNTHVMLTGNYLGVTNPSASGVFVNDYTYPDMIPTIAQGDVGTAAVFSAAMQRIQDMIKSVAPTGLLEYAGFFDDVSAMRDNVQAMETNVTALQSSTETSAIAVAAAAVQVAQANVEVQAVGLAALGASTTAQEKAVEASASALAAATSQTGAGTSAAQALANKDIAATKAGEATTSQTQSATSASQALASKTVAETKAAEAAASAAAALSSEGVANDKAGIATTKATEAANSATSAANSATAAQQAAVEASQGQINADWNAASGVALILNKPTIPSTKAHIGLANVDNTSDANKPVSTAQQTALDLKANASAVTSSLAAKADITYVDAAVAGLVDSSPSALDTLNELAQALGDDPNFATSMATSLGNRLRVDTAVQLLTAQQKANAVANLDLAAVATSGVKADVGLGNVDNTADANKPVSTAQAAAIATKQNVSDKDASGGYVGLTLFKINFKNALNTFTSFFTNANTAARTYTFQDRDGTIADLGSNTFSGAQTFSDQTIGQAMLKDIGVTFLDKGNSGTTAQSFDYTAGSHQKLTVTGAHTISVTSWPPTGNLGELLIELTNGASATITWPTINWVKSDGTTTTTFSSNGVTLQSSGTDWVLLWTRNGGTTIYGKIMR